MKSNELIEADYARSLRYYSGMPPQILGRLTLSQETAGTLPVDLSAVYEAVSGTIDENPAKAADYARTFGMVNVAVALDNSPTSFQFDRVGEYKPGGTAEIVTSRRAPLPELFSMPEVDAESAYLLAVDKPVSVELGLIQALHMTDTALVTGMYQPKLPLVRAIDAEELLRLRARYPDEVMLRLYGNVRGLPDAPRILGSVIPTAVLEKSGIATEGLNQGTAPASAVPARESIRLERLPAAFVGITTAKKPHIGHGFLLAKAIAGAGNNGRVFVELNDSGPRVERAVMRLADIQGIDVAQAAEAVTNGTLDINDVQAAYVSREDAGINADVPPFSLAGPNAYYRDLLDTTMPAGINCLSVADSELRDTFSGLQNITGYVPLFEDSGMSLLRDGQSAVVIEQGGKYTLAGILGAISTKYALRLIDSPPPLSSSERTVFKNIGLGIEQDSGTGVSIDFTVASGTNGSAVQIEDLLKLTKEKGLDARMLLPAFRAMLNSAYFLPGEGASLNANYASREAVVAAFEAALAEVSAMDEPEKLLYAPMQFFERKREIVRSMLAAAIGNCGFSAKPTAVQLNSILSAMPTLAAELTPRLTNFASSDKRAGPIPKSFIEEKDRKLFQTIASGTPDPTIKLLLDVASKDREAFDKLVTPSKLPGVMRAMGYDSGGTPDFLRKLQLVKGIYTI